LRPKSTVKNTIHPHLYLENANALYFYFYTRSFLIYFWRRWPKKLHRWQIFVAHFFLIGGCPVSILGGGEYIYPAGRRSHARRWSGIPGHKPWPYEELLIAAATFAFLPAHSLGKTPDNCFCTYFKLYWVLVIITNNFCAADFSKTCRVF